MSADRESGRRGAALLARMAAIDDGAILRVVFYGMLAATVVVVVNDFLQREAAEPFQPSQFIDPANPVLPSVERPEIDPSNPAFRPNEQVTTAPELLAAPLDIALRGNGILALTGTIDPGSAARYAEEVAARGEYVEVVALDSPGGSVEDALAIAVMVRENGFDTMVAAGSLCASSCPLILAAGDARRVAPGAAVGVHQIYAPVLPDFDLTSGQAMSDAQTITARITRHLTQMEVDPALWLHALETPPDRIYYFSPDELTDYGLATRSPDPALGDGDV